MKRSIYGVALSEEGDFDLAKQMQNPLDIDSGLSALDYSATSDHSSTDSGSILQHNLPLPYAPKSSKGSSNSKAQEDDERRRIRRERNKMAAAKCRQKRVDQTNTLLEETQKLEAEQRKLKEDIQNYEKQKEELEFIMESHLLHCNMKKDYGSGVHIKTEDANVAMNSLDESIRLFTDDIAHELDKSATLALKSENGKQFLILQSGSEKKLGKPVGLKNENGDEGGKNRNEPPTEGGENRALDFQQHMTRQLTVVRPSYFPTTSRLASDQGPADKQQTTATPTFFAIGLESMMEGHTGLTPLTGLPPFAVPGSQILLTPVISLPTDSLQNLKTPSGPTPSSSS